MREQQVSRCVLGVVLLLVPFFAIPLKAFGQEGAAAYVGSETCMECHDELEESYLKSLHARAWQSDPRWGSAGCESCHGPGEEHAEDPSVDNILSFAVDSERLPKEVNGACLQCHEQDEDVAMWRLSDHSKRHVTCSSCHPIHEGYSPMAATPDACYQCHMDIKIDSHKQARHPIREGKVTCSDCHNPHGTLNKGAIKSENLNELCYSCHGDKRGPHLWEHPPVEENCAECHDAHGSNHKGMLVQKTPNLCYRCHQSVHRPPWGAESGFRGSSPNNRFLARNCMNCHQNVHGSQAALRRGSRFIK